MNTNYIQSMYFITCIKVISCCRLRPYHVTTAIAFTCKPGIVDWPLLLETQRANITQSLWSHVHILPNHCDQLKILPNYPITVITCRYYPITVIPLADITQSLWSRADITQSLWSRAYITQSLWSRADITQSLWSARTVWFVTIS
jgi:hypothetical protein